MWYWTLIVVVLLFATSLLRTGGYMITDSCNWLNPTPFQAVSAGENHLRWLRMANWGQVLASGRVFETQTRKEEGGRRRGRGHTGESGREQRTQQGRTLGLEMSTRTYSCGLPKKVQPATIDERSDWYNAYKELSKKERDHSSLSVHVCVHWSAVVYYWEPVCASGSTGSSRRVEELRERERLWQCFDTR